MVSFEIFVKAMPPSLSELKVLPSFCFAFKIPDDVTATTNYHVIFFSFLIGVLASRADHTQRILTPDIINIPFIDWIIMNSHGKYFD